MKLLRAMKNYIYLSAFLFFVNPLHAAVTMTVDMSGDPVVLNKMNVHNILTINVTWDGAGTDYSSGSAEVWCRYGNSGTPNSTWAKMTIDGLITDEFELDDINKALDLFRSGEAGRIIVSMKN